LPVDTFPSPATEGVSLNHDTLTRRRHCGGNLWRLSQTSVKTSEKTRCVSHSGGWVDASTLRTGCLLHSLRTSAGAREEGQLVHLSAVYSRWQQLSGSYALYKRHCNRACRGGRHGLRRRRLLGPPSGAIWRLSSAGCLGRRRESTSGSPTIPTDVELSNGVYAVYYHAYPRLDLRG
jgi:hypothetical protein